jgi:hypothetical protein
MLAAWDVRPQQMRSLFNPAFCASLLCVAAKSYDKDLPAGTGIPVITTFLVLPLALHSETRNAFPATTKTSLTRWIGQHPEIHLGLAARVRGFRDITSEGIRYAIAGGIMTMTQAGGLRHVPFKPRGLTRATEASAEVSECFKVAADLGRWFARVPNAAFLFHTLRVRP